MSRQPFTRRDFDFVRCALKLLLEANLRQEDFS